MSSVPYVLRSLQDCRSKAQVPLWGLQGSSISELEIGRDHLMKSKEHLETSILTLGPAKIASPIVTRANARGNRCFVSEERILVNLVEKDVTMAAKKGRRLTSFERAGPHCKIFFDPSKLRCAIVSCGGLCPGINDIIRAIVLALYHNYGVRNIYGIQYGFQGFIPSYGH